MNLTVEDANNYYKCIDILSTREQLVSNQVSSWPQTKKDTRDKIHRELIKKADYEGNRKKALTGQDLKRILGNG